MHTVPTPVWRTRRFDREYRKLAPELQGSVDDALTQLRQNPESPSLNIESVRGASRGVKSCRVTRAVRLIYRVSPGGDLQLLHVGEHDKAYRNAVMHFMTFLTFADSEPDREALEMFDIPMDEPDWIMSRLQAELSELDLDSDLAGTIASFVGEALAAGTEGRAGPFDQIPGLGQGMINCIPSDSTGPCRDVLVALCFDGDSFDERFRDIAYHAGIHCPGTRTVVVVTSKWEPAKWKKNHAAAFANVGARVVIFLAGPRGLTRIL